MDDQARLDPVYNQLSAVRDDLSASYAAPQYNAGGYSDITTQIMNPALLSPSFPAQGFEAELSLMRYQGASEMRGLYEDAMRSQENRRTGLEIGMGVGGGAAFMAGSALGNVVLPGIGGFVGGLGASMLFEQLRDPLESLFKVNQMSPVVSGEDWTKGVLAEQMMAMSYMGGNFGPGGRAGLSMNQAESMGENLYGFMRNQGLQGMEITRLAPYIMQSGALDNSSNLDELTNNIEKQVETIANFVKRAGMKLEEAAQVTSGLVQAGVQNSDLMDVSSGIISTAAAAGVGAAQYGQFATSFAQPYAVNGNIGNVIGSLNNEVLFQDYLYQTGTVSRAEYAAGGRAVGAGGTIAQAGMSYWHTTANRRILYGMTASGGLNGAGISSMLAGGDFPESGMADYEAMTSEERAATRWQSGEMLNESPELFTNVMLSRMIGGLEEDGYNDPFSQRQMLMERYGIDRGMATQFERREELMYDPRTNMGVRANASQAAAQSSRTQAINTHNNVMRRVLGLGQALNTGENDRLSYGSRQQFRNRLLNGEDYETLVQEETSNTDSEMAPFLNSDLQTLSAGGTMSLDAIQATLSTMTPEEQALYGPQFADAANASLRADGGFLRGATRGLVYRRDVADNRGFGAGLESASFLGPDISGTDSAGMRFSNTSTRYNDETGNLEVLTQNRFGASQWLDASQYSFRNFDLNVGQFVDAMTGYQESNIEAMSRTNALSGMTSMMPTNTQVLYGQDFMRRYQGEYGNDPYAPKAPGPWRDGGELVQQAYNTMTYVNAAPTSAEAQAMLSNTILGRNDTMNTWYQGALQTMRDARVGFRGDVNEAGDVYAFANTLSTTLFGYNTEDARFSTQDSQRLDYFTSIAYPDIASARSSQQDSAMGAVGDTVRSLRASTGGALTADEREMRSGIGRRFGMSEQDWSTASDVMMMSYAERISLSESANRLGVEDASVLGATTALFGTQGAGRGAVIAAGSNGGIQMSGATQALARYDSLLDTSIGGNDVSMIQALAAYRRGEDVEFNYAEGVAGTDVGRRLQALVTQDVLSEETLAELIEADNQQRGTNNTGANTTGFEGGEVSMSSEHVSIDATTVSVNATNITSGGTTSTSVGSGAPGQRGPVSSSSSWTPNLD